MKKLIVAVALCGLSAGCGKAAEDKMNASYDENFRASCVSSSVKAGAPAAVASEVCECSLAEINKKFSATDKLTMSAKDAQPIMMACLEKAKK